jgi:hypothetical protein
MPQRPCDHCGKAYEAKRKTSRFCGVNCRNRHARHPELAVVDGGTSAPPAGAPPSTSPTVDAVRRELAAVDRLDSIAGSAALQLAAALDSPTETGSAKASLARQLVATLEVAMKGVKVADDPLDELKRRRDQKLGLA